MTIQDAKMLVRKLHKSIICFTTQPIKLPPTIWFDGKHYKTEEITKEKRLYEDGYLPVGTQCLLTDNYSFAENEIEIAFFIFMSCVIKSDEDVFSLWEQHKQELKELEDRK